MTSLQKLLIGRTSTHTMEKELPQSTKLWPQLHLHEQTGERVVRAGLIHWKRFFNLGGTNGL